MAESRLRVVFDAHALTPHRSGIGEYSWHLLCALVRDFRDEVDLHLYVPSGIHSAASEDDIARLTADVRDGDFFRASHQWHLPTLLRRGAYDLLHTPDFLVPLRCPVPLVCTIHDLIPLVHPEFIPRSLKVRLLPVFRAWARHATRRSAAVITDSAHSRGDILRLLGAEETRVTVVPLAPTLEVTGAPLAPAHAAVLREGRYLLYVGRHDPYKGLSHLFRAFAAARREGALDGVQLAVAGKRDPRYGHEDLATSLGIASDVVFLDYVDTSELSALYAFALAYVHPSLYEGFGLPPLDAMRHGVPVCCSDRSSLPEVVGDAALLFDPENSEVFSSVLKEIAENAILRRVLIQKGSEQVRRFSWNQTARRTVQAYIDCVRRV